MWFPHPHMKCASSFPTATRRGLKGKQRRLMRRLSRHQGLTAPRHPAVAAVYKEPWLLDWRAIVPSGTAPTLRGSNILIPGVILGVDSRATALLGCCSD